MKNIVFLTVVVLMTLNMKAQQSTSSNDSKIRFGLTASPMICWLKPDNSNIDRGKVRVGGEYGLIVDYFFKPNYGLSTGLLVDMVSGNVRYNDTTLLPLGTDVRFKIQHLNVPILLKLKTNEIGYMTYFGQFGVVPSFRYRARVDAENGAGTLYDNANFIKNNPDFDSNFFQLSLNVGGGVEWSLSGRTALLIGVFYNNGFINIVDDNDSERIGLNSVVLRTGILF